MCKCNADGSHNEYENKNYNDNNYKKNNDNNNDNNATIRGNRKRKRADVRQIKENG